MYSPLQSSDPLAAVTNTGPVLPNLEEQRPGLHFVFKHDYTVLPVPGKQRVSLMPATPPVSEFLPLGQSPSFILSMTSYGIKYTFG